MLWSSGIRAENRWHNYILRHSLTLRHLLLKSSNILPAIKANITTFSLANVWSIALVNVQQCAKVFKAALATIISCGVKESLSTVLMQKSLQEIFSERTALAGVWWLSIYLDRSGNNVLFTMPNFANLLYSLELPGLWFFNFSWCLKLAYSL